MDILQRQFSGGLIPTVIKENQSSSNGGLQDEQMLSFSFYIISFLIYL